ncbi:hypothetical protein ETD86_29605 [Nonomuraea turkmeniaca]|uniref:Uncharacterized protein n=1 Tax=Nonomuraea turkmeniaca TaxID=103838 RepID=A0A5S4FAE2_9ACTN|nr:hypothetical protein [Nonomuraea turkmeniaca]TMR14104.1 hypothetical protein ETD86_29605 [Nonomuraea turkmeniaca]
MGAVVQLLKHGVEQVAGGKAKAFGVRHQVLDRGLLPWPAGRTALGRLRVRSVLATGGDLVDAPPCGFQRGRVEDIHEPAHCREGSVEGQTEGVSIDAQSGPRAHLPDVLLGHLIVGGNARVGHRDKGAGDQVRLDGVILADSPVEGGANLPPLRTGLEIGSQKGRVGVERDERDAGHAEDSRTRRMEIRGDTGKRRRGA